MEDSVEYFVEDDAESDIDDPYKMQSTIKQSCILDDGIPDNHELDLILPEPNPLIKKVKLPLEPLRIIYKYPFKKLGKFEGKDKADNFDSIEEIRQDYKLKRSSFPESPIEYEKLEKYFTDEEKIVYIRDKQKLLDSFNTNYFNIKKYFKSKEESSMAIKKKKHILSSNSASNILIDANNNNTNNNYSNLKYQDYYYQPKSIDDKTLVFESKFESGNLSMVSKISDNEYNLALQNDVNTNGYIQWFFFEVNNTTKGMNIKFNIINFVKSDSIFNHGTKILVYSRKEYQSNKTGWFRGGINIQYFKNNILRETRNMNIIKTYRTLSFEYEFNHHDDQVYFAYAYPYTYSDLMEYLDQLEDDPEISKIMVRAPLCRTIAGNLCEVLTISNHSKPEHIHKKKCILLTSRVHPGETVSSFTIKGVIDFLTSKKEEAFALRENFIFKIIPMLNPDGVIHGNYRCDLAGCDLNRRWRKPINLIHPTVFSSKRLIENIIEKYKIALFCDFHGHSGKFNNFFYACSEPKNPFKSREFPFIMSRKCPIFSYRDCSFVAHTYKKNTARITIFEEYGTITSLCLETSFFGSNKTRKHFNKEDLEMVGHKFCESLLIFFCINPKNPIPLPKDKKGINSKKNGSDQGVVENFAQLKIKREYLEELYSNEENLKFGTKNEISDSDSVGSDDGLSKNILTKFVPKIRKPKPKLKRNQSYSFVTNGNLNLKKKSKSFSNNKTETLDNIKNALSAKEIQENIKNMRSKVNLSLSPNKLIKSTNYTLLNTNTGSPNQLESDFTNESPKKSLNHLNVRKSFVGKYDKLPHICVNDGTLCHHGCYKQSNKYGHTIEGEYKKPIVYNYCEYLQHHELLNSNDLQELNQPKIDKINKSHNKQIKSIISKEPLIPKDFICSFKNTQITNNANIKHEQRKNLRLSSRKIGVDLIADKEFINNHEKTTIIKVKNNRVRYEEFDEKIVIKNNLIGDNININNKINSSPEDHNNSELDMYTLNSNPSNKQFIKPKHYSNKSAFSTFQLFSINKSTEILENLSTRELNEDKTFDYLPEKNKNIHSLMMKYEKNSLSDSKIQWKKIFPKILNKSKANITTNDDPYNVKLKFFHQ